VHLSKQNMICAQTRGFFFCNFLLILIPFSFDWLLSLSEENSTKRVLFQTKSRRSSNLFHKQNYQANPIAKDRSFLFETVVQKALTDSLDSCPWFVCVAQLRAKASTVGILSFQVKLMYHNYFNLIS